jgi:hypothetical protein
MDNISLNQSQEEALHFPRPLRGAAWFFSTFFHPVFMPMIGGLLIIYTHPLQFGTMTSFMRFRIIASLAVNTLLLPVFTVFMLKVLGFTSSFYLHSRKDRIVPYIATMTYYFWIFYAFWHNKEFPLVLTIFLLGNFITIIGIFMANIFYKISAHAAAVGGMIGVIILMLGDPYLNISLPIMIGIMVAGIVLSSRLILSAHNNFEVYSGFLVGLFAQIIAVLII